MHKVTHHPKDETLADYAAGRLDEARSVVIATHLAYSEACRTAVADFEALGGACLEAVEPVEMESGSMAAFWERAGDQDVLVQSSSQTLDAANDLNLDVAQPLRAYLSEDIEDVKWKSIAPGISQHVLEAEGYRDGVLRLLKIAPGVQLPKHTHEQEELTLVLRGSYRDEIGTFGPGDLADLDDGALHAPTATGDEDCICLIATSAPLVFKGLMGRLVQPFVGL
ncbi:MAG: ChrR family anti-sigma-E factor [Pseudomonadota bacterium]